MKKAMYLIGGACWILFALGFGFFLIRYLSHGAGLPVFEWTVSSGSVLMGMIPVVALAVAAVLSFALGVRLCVQWWFGAVDREEDKAVKNTFAEPGDAHRGSGLT